MNIFFILETRTREVPKSVITETKIITKTNPEDLDQDRKDEKDRDLVIEIDHATETGVIDPDHAAVIVVILRQAIHPEEAVIGGVQIDVVEVVVDIGETEIGVVAVETIDMINQEMSTGTCF